LIRFRDHWYQLVSNLGGLVFGEFPPENRPAETAPI